MSTFGWGKTMLWSDTKDLVHKFTERTKLFITMEDTLLGSVLDGRTWCGLKDLEGKNLQELLKITSQLGSVG